MTWYVVAVMGKPNSCSASTNVAFPGHPYHVGVHSRKKERKSRAMLVTWEHCPPPSPPAGQLTRMLK